MNDLVGRELLWEIRRTTELFNSSVFTTHSIFTQSAFIEILIRLDYVLKQLRKASRRITWNDDIQTSQEIKDITDLVNNLRNAACHSDSQRNYVSNTNIKFVFNTFIGKSPKGVQIGRNRFLGNEYENDIAFYYGDKRIYLVRHIKRLLEQLPNEISKLD